MPPQPQRESAGPAGWRITWPWRGGPGIGLLSRIAMPSRGPSVPKRSSHRPGIAVPPSGLTRLSGALLLVLAAPAGAACDPGLVEIRGPAGAARFHVEIADTEAERVQGLMERKSLPASSGMLFVYDRPQPVAFWMRNTLIPLDMIFVDATGVVQGVHEGARPRDETPIPGPGPVLAVLEINGGLARRLGIAPGAQMRHPAFDPATAAWSCTD